MGRAAAPQVQPPAAGDAAGRTQRKRKAGTSGPPAGAAPRVQPPAAGGAARRGSCAGAAAPPAVSAPVAAAAGTSRPPDGVEQVLLRHLATASEQRARRMVACLSAPAERLGEAFLAAERLSFARDLRCLGAIAHLIQPVRPHLRSVCVKGPCRRRTDALRNSWGQPGRVACAPA